MRKVTEFVVTDQNRDYGKTFILTEMAADQAERWALRFLLAMAKGGAQLPAGALLAPSAGLAAIGLAMAGSMNPDDALPLLDELMGCIKFQPDNKAIPPMRILPGDGSQIEEVATRVKLKLAVLELHTGFSLPVAPLTSESAAAGTPAT